MRAFHRRNGFNSVYSILPYTNPTPKSTSYRGKKLYLPLLRMDNTVCIKMEEDEGYAGAGTVHMFGVHTVAIPISK